MRIEPFKLERFFAKYEFSARYLLSSSDCEPLPMAELLAMADAECAGLWSSLRLSYTEAAGHPLLRREIASLYDGLPAEGVLTLVPEEGIFIAMNVLLEPGGHAVATFPGYQSLYQLAESCGCALSKWTPGPDMKFRVADLLPLLKPETRLLVMNFPHNPTGALLPRAELDRLLREVRSRGIMVFSDEMYRYLEYDPADRLPALCELYEDGVSLGGLSKAFALPGLRTGWLASRNAEFLKKAAEFKDYTTICAGAPSEILSTIALRTREKLLSRSLGIISSNLALLASFAGRNASWLDWTAPRAGSVAFPALRRVESALEFCDALVRETGIMLVPSEVYDHPGKRVRFGFGRKNLPEILPLLEAWAAKRGPR